MEWLRNLERLRRISSKEATLGGGALLEDVRGLRKSWGGSIVQVSLESGFYITKI